MTVKHRLAWVWLAAVSALVMMNSAARADTWTIQDKTETIFTSYWGSLVENMDWFQSIVPENSGYDSGEVEVDWFRYSTYITQMIGPDGSVIPVGQGFYYEQFLEPGGGLSDSVYVANILNGAKVLFFSESENGGSPTCLYPCSFPFTPLTPVLETGTYQLLTQVTWADGSVDTVNFISDVPEPSGVMLLVTMLAGTVLYGRKRISF